MMDIKLNEQEIKAACMDYIAVKFQRVAASCSLTHSSGVSGPDEIPKDFFAAHVAFLDEEEKSIIKPLAHCETPGGFPQFVRDRYQVIDEPTDESELCWFQTSDCSCLVDCMNSTREMQSGLQIQTHEIINIQVMRFNSLFYAVALYRRKRKESN